MKPGAILADKYQIKRLLGSGGAGKVYRAHHVDLLQDVAIKVLDEQGSSDPMWRERFLREARVLARMRGEHIARAIDVGATEEGTPFIVMEYLSGRDLARVIEERGPLPVPEAIEYVTQLLEALAEAHSAGIVHRDLKPSNLFLTVRPDGSPILKVLDFGIAKLRDAQDDAKPVTVTAAYFGTPAYSAPEHLNDPKCADARSDIWSVGTVLFELLAGQRLFNETSLVKLIAAVMQSAPRPLRSVVPTAPAPLEAVILQCLSHDPAARFADVGALAEAIAPFGAPATRARVAGIKRTLAAPRHEEPESESAEDRAPAGGGTIASTFGGVSSPAPAGVALAPTIIAPAEHMATRPIPARVPGASGRSKQTAAMIMSAVIVVSAVASLAVVATYRRFPRSASASSASSASSAIVEAVATPTFAARPPPAAAEPSAAAPVPSSEATAPSVSPSPPPSTTTPRRIGARPRPSVPAAAPGSPAPAPAPATAPDDFGSRL